MVHAKMEKIGIPSATMSTWLNRFAPKFFVSLEPTKYITSIQKRSALWIQPRPIRSITFSTLRIMQIGHTGHIEFGCCLSVSKILLVDDRKTRSHSVKLQFQRNGSQHYCTDAGQIGANYSPIRCTSCTATFRQCTNR